MNLINIYKTTICVGVVFVVLRCNTSVDVAQSENINNKITLQTEHDSTLYVTACDTFSLSKNFQLAQNDYEDYYVFSDSVNVYCSPDSASKILSRQFLGNHFQVEQHIYKSWKELIKSPGGGYWNYYSEMWLKTKDSGFILRDSNVVYSKRNLKGVDYLISSFSPGDYNNFRMKSLNQNEILDSYYQDYLGYLQYEVCDEIILPHDGTIFKITTSFDACPGTTTVTLLHLSTEGKITKVISGVSEGEAGYSTSENFYIPQISDGDTLLIPEPWISHYGTPTFPISEKFSFSKDQLIIKTIQEVILETDDYGSVLIDSHGNFIEEKADRIQIFYQWTGTELIELKREPLNPELYNPQ